MRHVMPYKLTAHLHFSRDQSVYGLAQQVLRTDVSGMPLEWVDYRDAVRLYHTGQVVYACGSLLYRLFGGINARSGRRSFIGVSSIIATHSDTHNTPPRQPQY